MAPLAQIWKKQSCHFPKTSTPLCSKCPRPMGFTDGIWIYRKSTADDYNNNINPSSNLSDAVQHSAGKPFVCMLDCFQANHCLQISDQWSVELLAIVLSVQLLPTKNLHKALAEQCVQYVDDYGIDPCLKRLFPGTIGQSLSWIARQDWSSR